MLQTMDTAEILLAVLLAVLGAALTFIGSMILHRLKAAEERAKEDRAANKADHDRLFALVSDLKAVVEVLRDRSERSDSAVR